MPLSRPHGRSGGATSPRPYPVGRDKLGPYDLLVALVNQPSRVKGAYIPMTTQSSKAGEIEIVGPVTAEFAQVLTPDAMKFVATLVRTFTDRREELLQRRAQRQIEINAGKM